MSDPQASPLWKKRFALERAIRETLWSWGYEETRTPLLVCSPGMEPHICPVEVKRAMNEPLTPPVFLPTSPEFAMKKLLAQGMPKIFQIGSSFRDEPESPEHRPEFTMLEFYETEISIEAFQSRVSELIQSVARKLQKKSLIPDTLNWRGQTIDLFSQWPRFRVVDLFQFALNIDLRKHENSEDLAKICQAHSISADPSEPWDDLYFKLWLNCVEPTLPKDSPCFVTHYPLSQSSLCNRVKDETGYEWANRFELYLGTFELGNAFDELRDSNTQRKNFERDQKIRRDTYGDRYPESPIDEALLTAISSMPPTCGIALGLDRIAMLLLGATQIDQILPLQPFWPKKSAD